ncbi:hypothetical protein DPMN_019001 [Dreissena polymorpha]|uniref:Uncharacterized protein n=1 Tax=Dreissena polymorpha TaxID=45954 RepID=A0A9D4S9R6_DREPO|nr:hypothetical protein DPMN_019001 [Dreissena polymorpha]
MGTFVKCIRRDQCFIFRLFFVVGDLLASALDRLPPLVFFVLVIIILSIQEERLIFVSNLYPSTFSDWEALSGV